MGTDIEHGTLKSYIVGLLLSVVLTLIAYYIVVLKLLQGPAAVISVVSLALIQAWVQLVLFLHLGKESKSRANLMIFLFMVLILAIVLIGTLWIMYSLNDRTMPFMEMTEGI